ncbi:hypothetical protein [Aquimarina sp. MMG016]|uniref:hypothetical protein n=1 Tax=Aquimarina sp. MMG016 TaxID=2822690 RepID=UPI001B39D9B7|nr:hypothetical protein [Aquimarina sp. MMG016]MBQ4822647.1 hypothetical protein [Aquimarina sp. MMG016]
MFKKLIIGVLAIGFVATSCSDDDDTPVLPVIPNAGTISGGPFSFDVDGEPDMVSGITLNSAGAIGSNSTWVITDDSDNILGRPGTLEMVEGVNFDDAGPGNCFIWYARFEDDSNITTAATVGEITGRFDLSNSIEVVRNQVTNAGKISGGPFSFDVDGTPDMVSGIMLDDTNAFGTNSTWVITDEMDNILGRPGTLEMVEGVDFNAAGPGTCFIWYARYEDDSNIATAATVGDITGTFDLSNSIEVVRNCNANAGMISGGTNNEFVFTVDGTPDMVSGITLSGDASGTNRTWVITDDQGEILGLPGTLEMVQGIDFDDTGVGVCLIWYLRFEDGLEGAEVGMNANDLKGCFSLSNSIKVTRNAP